MLQMVPSLNTLPSISTKSLLPANLILVICLDEIDYQIQSLIFGLPMIVHLPTLLQLIGRGLTLELPRLYSHELLLRSNT